MDEEYVIIPSAADEGGYVPLSRTKQGKLFRKHLLSTGTLYHPKSGSAIDIDDAFLATVKKNFDEKACDIVQVPLANERNEHSEHPKDNLGEVVDLEISNGKLYGYIDIRDEDAAPKMGKTLLGASAMLALDYVDSRTNKPVGPTLLHSCVTNRPYVLELEDYEEIVAATSDRKGEAVLLSATPSTAEAVVAEAEQVPEETDMTLEELLAELKTEHDIDVSALQAKVAELETSNASLTNERDEAVKLSSDLTGALEASGVVSLTAGSSELTPSDVIGAVGELAQSTLKLSQQVRALAEKDARNEVDKLVASGKVLPAQADAMTELKLSNPEMFDRLIPDAPLVPMEKEVGVVTPEGEAAHINHIEEIARLTAPGGPAYQYIDRSSGKK